MAAVGNIVIHFKLPFLLVKYHLNALLEHERNMQLVKADDLLTIKFFSKSQKTA